MSGLLIVPCDCGRQGTGRTAYCCLARHVMPAFRARKLWMIPLFGQLRAQRPAVLQRCSSPPRPSQTAPRSCGAHCAASPLSLQSLGQALLVPMHRLPGWDTLRSWLPSLPAHCLFLGILQSSYTAEINSKLLHSVEVICRGWKCSLATE